MAATSAVLPVGPVTTGPDSDWPDSAGRLGVPGPAGIGAQQRTAIETPAGGAPAGTAAGRGAVTLTSTARQVGWAGCQWVEYKERPEHSTTIVQARAGRAVARVPTSRSN